MNITFFHLHKRVDKDTLKLENFDKICDWLETREDSELYTFDEMYNKMIEMTDDTENIYTRKRFTDLIKERYKGHLYYSEQQGKRNVVCFKNMATYILSKFKSSSSVNKYDIIRTAAKLIKEDIKALTKSKENYPRCGEIVKDECCEYTPKSLKNFLKILIPSDLKCDSIGQCDSKVLGLQAPANSVFYTFWARS